MTSHLPRRRGPHLPERTPRPHRYQAPYPALPPAISPPRLHDRLMPAGLAQLTPGAPPGKLRTAATAYQTAIDDIIRDAGLAA